MRTVRRAYAIGAVLWLAALPLGVYLATREHASTVVHATAFTIYSIGSLICHQRPERSFHLWGAQLPVCARCTGIYLGAAALAMIRRGGPVCPPGAGASATGADTQVGPYAARVVVALASLPTIATLVYEWTTGDTPSNVVRFVAGLPLGAVVSWLIIRVN